jgi:hypothetical protein
MSKIPPSIEPLFLRAGWQHPAGSTAQPPVEPGVESAESRAAALISEFGGLRIGAVGAGRDLAASDVHFYSEHQQEDASLVEPWLVQLGTLGPVASAHNDHMIIFVDANGRFYAFTDPDGRLYLIGQALGEAMERLLL